VGLRRGRRGTAPKAASGRREPPPQLRRLAAAALDLARLIATYALAAGKELIRPPRRKPPPVLRPYIDLGAWWRKVAKFIVPVVLAFFCLAYGFYFALTAPYLIVPFAAPVALLCLLAIWALPTGAHAPTRVMEFFFAALFITLVLWPNYLALALPGLPWITAIRLTGFPMAFLLLLSLSTSEDFRGEVAKVLRVAPPLWKVIIVFGVMQFVTLVFAKNPPDSFQRVLIQQLNWTAIFVLSAYICRVPGRVERYIGMLMALAVPIAIVTAFEATQRQVLWREHVPAFLKVDDAIAGMIMKPQIRGATGIYRAKATFSTALGLAEYVALLTPFAIHFAVAKYKWTVRVFGLFMIWLIFYVVLMTDARLGVVGFLISFLLYLLLWGLQRFWRNRRDLLGAAAVYAYPAIFLAFMVAVNFINRLHNMVFGSGAQTASDQARKNQMVMGVPKILMNPIGHGAGNSGMTMGYGEGQFVTVDNYYLTLGLDYGVIGLATFLAMFMIAAGYGATYGVRAARGNDRELSLMMPLAIALSAFLVIKSVFSQQDNHPLVFMMMGMIVGLLYRATIKAREAAPADSQQPAASTRGAGTGRSIVRRTPAPARAGKPKL
jgi:hypothetical protein